MLPKINRLKKKKDIERVFRSGKGIKEDFLILKTAQSSLKNPRFAFIVSSKVSKKAVLRNKIRRRLSKLAALKIGKIKKNIDFVLIAAPGLENKDFWETDETINKLFQKARCFSF